MTRLMTVCTLLAACVAAVAGEGDSEDAKKKDPALYPRVKMETTLGDIVLELNGEKAPVTVTNFIQYAQDKFYDGTVFHRVIKTFMIQGGGFTAEMGKKTEGLRDGIKNEWQNGLKNERGTISMARLGGQPDSGTSQFFVNVVDNSRLDQAQRDGAAYAVFGKVVEGMDTVDKIRNTPVSANVKYDGGRAATVPTEPVVIKSVRVVGDFDSTKLDAMVKEAEASGKAEEEIKLAEEAKQKTGFAPKLEEAKAKGTKTESGLIYYDTKVGDGPTPESTDRVEVHYTGWLTDGTKFDSSVDRGQPFTFSLTGGVIQGWLEGVATMKVGGKRTLVIPPEMAYGERGRPSIPGNSTLVFDVELLAIK